MVSCDRCQRQNKLSACFGADNDHMTPPNCRFKINSTSGNFNRIIRGFSMEGSTVQSKHIFI